MAALVLVTACGETRPETAEQPSAAPTEETGTTEGSEPGAETEPTAEPGASSADTSPATTATELPSGPEASPTPPREDAGGFTAPDEGEVGEPPRSAEEESAEAAAPSAEEEHTDEEAPQLAVDDPARITTISDDLRALMEQTTWEPGCPVEIDELRKLTLRYVDLDDVEHEGELIVHQDVADDLLGVFVALYEDRFPIARMEPIEHFDGDDDASMAANNTSAFNCRPITGSDSWSEHSYGWAVDINPIQNPYERDGEVLPPEGEPYLDRDDVRPGMVTRPGVVEYFDELGWGWGGDWNTLKDYMHFSLTGR